MTKHIHGGDVYTYKDCLDFSANLNPLGNTGTCETGHYPQSGSYCTVSSGGVSAVSEKKSQQYEGVKPRRNCLRKRGGRGDLYALPRGKSQKGTDPCAYICRVRTGTGKYGV